MLSTVERHSRQGIHIKAAMKQGKKDEEMFVFCMWRMCMRMFLTLSHVSTTFLCLSLALCQELSMRKHKNHITYVRICKHLLVRSCVCHFKRNGAKQKNNSLKNNEPIEKWIEREERLGESPTSYTHTHTWSPEEHSITISVCVCFLANKTTWKCFFVVIRACVLSRAWKTSAPLLYIQLKV